MQELIIQIEEIDPVGFFGPNNKLLNILKGWYPKLKIVSRGDLVKVYGQNKDLESFESKFKQMIEYYNRYNQLNESNLERILESNGTMEIKDSKVDKDVLLYGQNGILVKPRNPNQKKMVTLLGSKDMLFAVGPAGTGKTYMAVTMAVRALKDKEVKRIILTRPAVEAGENLGFLPGDLKEKLDPYLQPLYDALHDMIPGDKLNSFVENGVIQIAPLAFMRGRTLDNAFVILDEAQNTTQAQMKMFLTRMGKSAKFIITGDITQIDLPANQSSGLVHALKVLKGIKDIGLVQFDEKDVVRHGLVKKIIKAYE